MSDWTFLNAHRMAPSKSGPAAIWGSTPADGFNGAFFFRVNNCPIRVIASDGLGWQHVSVSIVDSDKPPAWSVMCQVKDLFWEPEDTVMQLHPPQSLYVNFHPGCLHLWRPTMEGVTIPLPHPLLVGPKTNQNKERQKP